MNSRANILKTMLPILGLIGDLPSFIDKRKPEPPPKKPCLNCGKLKQHNNSFCSAECCREHREKPKA